MTDHITIVSVVFMSTRRVIDTDDLQYNREIMVTNL